MVGLLLSDIIINGIGYAFNIIFVFAITDGIRQLQVSDSSTLTLVVELLFVAAAIFSGVSRAVLFPSRLLISSVR